MVLYETESVCIYQDLADSKFCIYTHILFEYKDKKFDVRVYTMDLYDFLCNTIKEKTLFRTNKSTVTVAKDVTDPNNHLFIDSNTLCDIDLHHILQSTDKYIEKLKNFLKETINTNYHHMKTYLDSIKIGRYDMKNIMYKVCKGLLYNNFYGNIKPSCIWISDTYFVLEISILNKFVTNYYFAFERNATSYSDDISEKLGINSKEAVEFLFKNEDVRVLTEEEDIKYVLTNSYNYKLRVII